MVVEGDVAVRVTVLTVYEGETPFLLGSGTLAGLLLRDPAGGDPPTSENGADWDDEELHAWQAGYFQPYISFDPTPLPEGPIDGLLWNEQDPIGPAHHGWQEVPGGAQPITIGFCRRVEGADGSFEPLWLDGSTWRSPAVSQVALPTFAGPAEIGLTAGDENGDDDVSATLDDLRIGLHPAGSITSCADALEALGS